MAFVSSLALVLGGGSLVANLGTIKVNETAASVSITSANFGGVAGVVSGSTVTFSGISDMTVGEARTLTIVVGNSGGTAATLGTPVITGTGMVLTVVVSGSLPTTVAGHGSATLTWTVTAAGQGSASPQVSIPWS